MKKGFLLFVTCLFTHLIHAQSPFVWGRAGMTTTNFLNNEGKEVASDRSGNVYATASFQTTSLSFGSFTLSNPTGQQKIYLVKYDQNGNVLWATTINGATSSSGNCVTADDSGNVYLAGYYSGGTSISFFPLTISNTNAPKFFLAKYDSNGNALWVQSMGHQWGSSANSVIVDRSGNIYLTATSFDTTVVFDTITVNSTFPGWQEVYLVRYNAAGHPLWVRHFGSNQMTLATEVSTDTSGNIYLTGQFKGTTLVIGTDTLHNAGTNTEDIFISKFSPSGNSIWNKRIGSSDTDLSYSSSCDRFGHLYIGGYYYSPSITIGPNTFTNMGAPDGFLAKMDCSNGTISWSRDIRGTSLDFVYGVCSDSLGNVFFEGGFDIVNSPNPSYFISFGSLNLYVMGGSRDPVFVIKLDSAMNVVNSVVMQTGGDDFLGIAKDPSSPAVYISGDAEKNPWYFGNDTLTGGINSGEYIFTAKINLSNTGLYATSTGINGTNCMNACSGSAICNAGGGTPPYSYHWLPGNQTTSTISNLCAGNYTVTVTDANLATVTNVVSVSYQSSGPTVTVATTPVSCNGICNGSYTITVTGGTGPYNISPWGGNTNLCAGNYPVTVTDANGCMVTVTAVITQPPPLTGTLTVTNASCPSSANGSIACFASGGTGPYSYTWQPGNLSDSTISGLVPGTYTCCITDFQGCQTCVSATVNSSGSIPATPGAISGQITICSGSTNMYSITAVPGATSYTWTLPSGWTGASTTNSISATASSTSGNVTVTANSACGSSPIRTLAVTVNSIPTTPGTISGATTICSGSSNTYSITAVSGATSYTWTLPGSWTGTSTINSITATASSTSGTITVTANNSCGSSAAQTLAITVSNPILTLTSMPVTCFGSCDGSIIASAAGGISPYTYSPSLNNLCANTYTVTVTDNIGCIATQSVAVTEPTVLSSASSSTLISCNGGNSTVTVTGSGGTSPYSGTGTFTVTAGTYSYTVTDTNGCTSTTSITVTEPTVLVASLISTTNPSSCGSTDGLVDISVSGGTVGYAFLWSNASTTEDLSGVGAGAYNCSITDTNGCTTFVNAILNDPNAPTVTLALSIDTACQAITPPFPLTGESPSGGTFSGPGVTGSAFFPMTANLGYNVILYTYTDTNGCTGSALDSIWVDLCMGITSPSLAKNFTLMPNPTYGAFIIDLSEFGTSENNFVITITDLTGRVIRKQEVDTSEKLFSVDLSDCSKGMYLIYVTDGTNQNVQHLIVE